MLTLYPLEASLSPLIFNSKSKPVPGRYYDGAKGLYINLTLYEKLNCDA